jgi:beta-glucosidase-like glycosyl hydrolase
MKSPRASSLGQLLLIGVRDYRWSRDLERTLRTYQPSGVVLSPESLRSPGQTADLLGKIARTLREPPFFAVAEEGGTVSPLKAFLPPLPAPRVLARRGPAAVKRLGELIGGALRLLSFNMNFAPRLDLSNPHVKPALDTQTFGSDPKQVAQCGKAFIEGLRKHGILACGKHFPGRGVPQYDENGMPIVGKTMAELWREDLLPFRELLPHLRLLKLSIVSYKAYDFDIAQPAAMSANIIGGLLRVKLGYQNALIADPFQLHEDMPRQPTAQDHIGLELQVLLSSIKAGCDLQIARWGDVTAGVILKEMQRAFECGSLPRERVEEALRRIRTVKRGLKRPGGKLSTRSFDRLTREFEEFSKRIRSGGDVEA